MAHQSSPAGQSTSERVGTLVLRQRGGPLARASNVNRSDSRGQGKSPAFAAAYSRPRWKFAEVSPREAATGASPKRDETSAPSPSPQLRSWRKRRIPKARSSGIHRSLAPDCSTVSRESSRKTSLRRIRKASRSRSAIRNPQSAIRHAQSAVPPRSAAFRYPAAPHLCRGAEKKVSRFPAGARSSGLSLAGLGGKECSAPERVAKNPVQGGAWWNPLG